MIKTIEYGKKNMINRIIWSISNPKKGYPTMPITMNDDWKCAE